MPRIEIDAGSGKSRIRDSPEPGLIIDSMDAAVPGACMAYVRVALLTALRLLTADCIGTPSRTFPTP